jgi:hypothetical protein
MMLTRFVTVLAAFLFPRRRHRAGECLPKQTAPTWTTATYLFLLPTDYSNPPWGHKDVLNSDIKPLLN